MFLYVHHVHYVVNNCDEMAAYMEKNFGMKPDFIGINSNGKEARYKIDKTQIQMVEPLPGSKQERYLAEHGPGVYHVAWAVKDAFKRKAINSSKAREQHATTIRSPILILRVP